VLAWHANTAPRWLDLQRHYRGTTPDHFLNVVHDARMPRLLGTAKVSRAEWTVPAKCYQDVGHEGSPGRRPGGLIRAA